MAETVARCAANLRGGQRRCKRDAFDDLDVCSQHVRTWAQANTREWLERRRGRVDAVGVHWIARATFELEIVFRVLRKSGPALVLRSGHRTPHLVHEIKGGVLLRVDVDTAFVLADEAEALGDSQTAEMLAGAARLGQQMAGDRTSAMRAVLVKAGFSARDVDRALSSEREDS